MITSNTRTRPRRRYSTVVNVGIRTATSDDMTHKSLYDIIVFEDLEFNRIQ